MRKTTVAVILSNYNHGRYLSESLGAICGQTRPADQIVVSDDGSTDNSAAIIEEFARRFSRIQFLRNERNLGLQKSIARALELVKTDYVVWAASDDRLLPEFLEKSMATLERHPEAGLCFSELSVLREDSGQVERLAANPEVKYIYDLFDLPEYMTPSEIVRRMKRAYLPITSNSVVVRRDALLAIGGYLAELEWYSDSFAYTVVALRYGACVVPETLALLRANPGSYSHGGMRDPARQRAVLTAILEVMARPSYGDIRRAFRQCASNFFPWGTLVLKLQLRRMRDWDLFLACLLWKIGDYKRRHQSGWPQTFMTLGLRLFRSVSRRVLPRRESRSRARADPAAVSPPGALPAGAGHGTPLRGALVTRDFTLIVPTYNRPRELSRMLRYLARQAATFPILVLDSGSDKSKVANAALVAELDLNIRLIAYESSLTPFEKFWRGTEEVMTAFCSLCADDDIVMVESLQPLIEFLQDRADFSVAHGWYFTFYDNVHFGITSVVYSGGSLDREDPVSRLRDMFSRYEAVTYAVYRTEVMRHALQEVQSMSSMLTRELLAGALTVVSGKVARLPFFYYGRSLHPSVPYDHWHPINFLVSSPESLFGEYAKYRRIILENVEKSGYRRYDSAEVLKLIDLMHLRYLSEYFTPNMLDYVIGEVMTGTDAKEILRGVWPRLTPTRSPALNRLRESKLLGRLRDRFAPGFRLHHALRLLGVEENETVRTTTVGGRAREYRLYWGFLSSVERIDPANSARLIDGVIRALNVYE